MPDIPNSGTGEFGGTEFGSQPPLSIACSSSIKPSSTGSASAFLVVIGSRLPIIQKIALAAAVPSGGDPPNTSYACFSGNTISLEFMITDQNESPLPLPGCIIQYYLRLTGGAPLAGFPRTAVISTEPYGEGKCTLLLTSSDTAPIVGTFEHLLKITDPSETPADITSVMIGSATYRSGGV